jgi:hypothetical protein
VILAINRYWSVVAAIVDRKVFLTMKAKEVTMTFAESINPIL